MGIETLNAMTEHMQASLMMMIEVIMLICILFTVVGLSIYLAGIAWLCFKDSGSLRRQIAVRSVARKSGRLRPAKLALYAACRSPHHYNDRKLRVQLRGES